jgi:hypothetical protein
VQSAQGVALHAGAVVTGAILQSTPTLPPFPTPSVTFPSHSSGDVNVPAGGQVTLAPGSFGNVNVQGKLSLSAGAYFLGTLHVWPGGTLDLDVSAGTINVYVQGSVNYEGQIVNNNLPSQFVLSYLGSQPVLVHSAFSGVLIAPSAMLQLGLPGDHHVGAFFAKDIKVFQGTQVTQVAFACTVP